MVNYNKYVLLIFRNPVLNIQSTYFCCGATSANSSIRPETSTSYDFGFELFFNEMNSNFSITYFDQDMMNAVDTQLKNIGLIPVYVGHKYRIKNKNQSIRQFFEIAKDENWFNNTILILS